MPLHSLRQSWWLDVEIGSDVFPVAFRYLVPYVPGFISHCFLSSLFVYQIPKLFFVPSFSFRF